MSDVKWIKIVTNIFDDEKIQLIEAMPESDAIIVIWFKILCLAGRSNTDGLLMMANKIPYTEPMLATIFRCKTAVLRLALETFQNFGMIEINNSVISLPNWEKHQNIEGLERQRELTKNRVQKFRERQKQALESSSVALHVTDVNATDKRIEKKERDKRYKIENERFCKPTISEVEAYCLERNNGINAESFVNFYESKGWMVGSNHMKDWKASVRTWEQKRKTQEDSRHMKTDDESWTKDVNEDGTIDLRRYI